MRIRSANAEYTGGGCYLYTGRLWDGMYFMAASEWWGSVLILNADPTEDLDQSGYPEWQEKHTVTELVGEFADNFLYKAMEWILFHKPDGNYSVEDIERERDHYKPTYCIIEEKDALKISHWYIMRNGIRIHKCPSEEDAQYILDKYYRD